MSDNLDIFISNGTCYSAANLQADDLMIPCGNDANEHVPCCQAGDNCLESRVCFNSDYGVTYVSGCTDPEYKHESCPDKFSASNTPWLGLSYCNGTSNEWVLCDQEYQPPIIFIPDPCYCPTDKLDRTMTLAQAAAIPGTASLPTTLGESIQFSRGYYPTRHMTASSSTTTGTPASAATPSAFPPRSSPSPASTTAAASALATTGYGSAPSHAGGLSPNAKIGAAIGAVAGALVLLAVVVGYLCIRRRRKSKQFRKEEDARAVDHFINGGGKGGGGGSADPLDLGLAPGAFDDASGPNTPAMSELDTKAARPWSMRSELDPGAAVRGPAAAGRGPGHARPGPSELAAHPIAELPG